MTRLLLMSLLLAGCVGETDKDLATADDSGDDSTSPEDSPGPPDGAALYGEHCARCHGEDARGGRGGPDLSVELRLSDAQLIAIILNGEDDMPPADVTEAEAQAIVDWLRANL